MSLSNMRKRQSWGEIFFVWVLAIFFAAWVLMFIVGALHAWWPTIPTMGYLMSLFLTWLIRWFYAALTFDNES